MPFDNELQDLWTALDDAATRACRSFGNESLIQAEIAALRSFYSGQNLGQSPNFADEAVQTAYVVAYHPLHSYSYLSMLQKWGLGEAMFSSLAPSPRILSLGSGAAAEVTALARWLKFRQRGGPPEPVMFELVDRVGWAKVRNLVADPAVEELKNSGVVEIKTKSGDLLSPEVIGFLKTCSGRYEVVLLPSSITEMSESPSFPALVAALRSLVESGSRLVVVDHDVPGLTNAIRPLLASYEVRSDEIPKGSIKCPLPNGWLRANLFGPSQIPSRSYKFRWHVVAK